MRYTNEILRGLCLSFLLCLPLMSSAQAQEPVRQVVPYSGHLDQGGRAFDGTAALRFRVYAQPAEGDVLWTGIHPAVNVRDGRFAVRLGEQPVPEGQTGIVELATAGHQLYLELSVALPEPEGVEPDWTQLAGRQALHPAPQALWTATGSNLEARRVTAFEVDVTGHMFNSGDGPLAVNDSLFVNGDTRVAGSLRVDGAISDGNSDVTVDDGLIVEENLRVRGRIVSQTLRSTPHIGINAFGEDGRRVGPSADNHICVLGRVWTDDAGSDCYVQPNAGRWDLVATNASCVMYCFQFAD